MSIFWPWSVPQSPVDLNAPVLVKGGVLKKFKRDGARGVCESPLLGIVGDGEEPVPCFETTYGEYLELKKSELSGLLIDLELTYQDFRTYVYALTDTEYCNTNTGEIHRLAKELGLPLEKYQKCGSIWNPCTPEKIEDQYYAWINDLAKKLTSIAEAEFSAIIDEAFPGPTFRRKDEKASRRAGYDIFVPSCVDFLGICCLYTETLDTSNRFLPEVKKIYSCKENITEAECQSYTKRYGGEYDGNEFYSNFEHEGVEAVDCRKCSDDVYHIVYCVDGIALMKTTLSLTEKDQWYIDNAEEIDNGWITNINVYVGRVQVAENEMIRRANTDECNVVPTETTVTPTEPTVTPTEPTVTPTEPTVTPTEPTATILSWSWPAPE